MVRSTDRWTDTATNELCVSDWKMLRSMEIRFDTLSPAMERVMKCRWKLILFYWFFQPSETDGIDNRIWFVQGWSRKKSAKDRGTRCPAWSDWLKKWSESRAVAPKGRCPVGHRGEFPYVLRGHTWGLNINFPWYSMGILHFFQFFVNMPYCSMGIWGLSCWV